MNLDTSVLVSPGFATGVAVSIKATLVLAIGATATWLLRRRSAAGRHFVWLLALIAVLGVTALATMPRGFVVEIPRWPQWASARAVAPPPAAQPRIVPVEPAAPFLAHAPAARGVTDPPVRLPMAAHHEEAGAARGAGAHRAGAHGARVPAAGPLAIEPPASEPLVTGSLATRLLAIEPPAFEPLATEPLATRQPAARPGAIVSPGLLLIMAWLTGAFLVLGWLVLGHVGLARIARRSEPVEDPAWNALLRRLAHEAGVERLPRLCSSADVGAPLVCGLFRHTILLPVEAASWGAERRRVVLLHELAHIARRDPLTQSMAWLACSIYWFQPAAWLAFARLRAESERACDDRVLSTGMAAPDYASHLLSIARRARSLRLAGAVSIAMARSSTLEGRLLALLDDGVRRGGLGLRARGAGVVTLALVLVALGLVRPVRPAAALAPAMSSESGSAGVPAANPGHARVAQQALAVPAEPAAGVTPIPRAMPASDWASLPATDPSTTPAVDPFAAPAADQSLPTAVERAASAAVAPSLVGAISPAGDNARAGTEQFRADPPARPADAPASDSKRASPSPPPFGGFSLPALNASAPTGPAPGPAPAPAPNPAPGPAPNPVPAAGAITWKNPGGGLWSNPANWDTGDVPDAAGESAVLPAMSGGYQVTLDMSPTLDAISIESGDAALDVNGFSIAGAKLVNNSGTIRNFAGDYNSNQIRNLKGGTVSVAPGGTIRITTGALWTAGTIVAAKEIHWAGNVSLVGGGALVLNDTRLLDPNVDQDVTDQFERMMSIAGGTTLRGTGEIFKQNIENSGLIEADIAQKGKGAPEKVLWFNGTIRNNGTIRVLNGGHINVNRPAIFNANGLITSGPGGGSVRLEMPFKMLGSIGALGGGCYTPPPTKGFIRADGGDLEIVVGAMYEGRIQRGPGGGVVKMAHVTMQNVFVDAGAELHFRPVAFYGPPDRPDMPALGIGSTFVTSTETVQLITNNGTIRFTGGSIDNGSSGRAQTIIRGTGELILEDATIGTGSGDTFVNGAGHTIRGCGSINAPFINEGTVALDCAPGKPARIGGTAIPQSYGYDSKPLRQAAGSIENRGRISIARGTLSIAGPEAARIPIETAVPTVVTNKGTIAAGALGQITFEKSVTVDNARGILATEGGGRMNLGATTGATVIGGRLDAVEGSKVRKAESGRGAAGGNLFWVEKAATLRDFTLGPNATLVTAEGAVTTAAGKRVVNDGTNRIAGRFVVPAGTKYVQIAGETLVEGGEFLGLIERGSGNGGAGMGPSSATIVAGPATLRFYARSEPRGFVLELPQAAEVDGRVYDAAGRQVARIADGAREAGIYQIALGRAGGAGLPSGIYFGRMIVTSAGRREVLQSRIAVIE